MAHAWRKEHTSNMHMHACIRIYALLYNAVKGVASYDIIVYAYIILYEMLAAIFWLRKKLNVYCIILRSWMS